MQDFIVTAQDHNGTATSFFEAGRAKSHQLFDVGARQAAFIGRNKKAHTVPGHKAIIREQGGQPVCLGMVQDGYTILKNKDLFDAVEKGLTTALAPADFKGAMIRERTSFDGAYCARTYVFNELAAEVKYPDGVRKTHGFGSGTKLGFQLTIVNGFGGRHSVMLKGGSIDFFCMNGMVLGTEYHRVWKKHTKSLTLAPFDDYAAIAVSKFYENVEMVQQWANTVVTDEAAVEFFEKVASPKLAQTLTQQWDVERATRGNTAFAVASVLTHYASHPEDFGVRGSGGNPSNDNVGAALSARDEQVGKWLAGEHFLKLVA